MGFGKEQMELVREAEEARERLRELIAEMREGAASVGLVSRLVAR